MLEWQRGLLYEGTLAEYWGRPALEAFIGHWARDFRLSLLRAGYTPEQLVYFQTHEDALTFCMAFVITSPPARPAAQFA